MIYLLPSKSNKGKYNLTINKYAAIIFKYGLLYLAEQTKNIMIPIYNIIFNELINYKNGSL